MSVSAPREQALRNPAKKFIKWKGGDEQGWFEYYDKEIEDPKLRNVKIDLGEGFQILDEDLFSITGFIDATKSNIGSNEVRGINDEIIVKSYKDKKAEIMMKGPYTVLKDQVKDSKMYHYTKCIYILFRGELCHLQISGMAFAKWLTDVQPNSNRTNRTIRHSDTEKGKQGVVKYIFPRFEVGGEVDKETWDKMLEVDSTILQPYLKSYLKSKPSDVATTEEPENVDTSKWRQVKNGSGGMLGDMKIDDIRLLSEALVEDGKADTPLYSYVGQALYDYQQAVKEWDKKKDRIGRLLSDYSLDELKAVMAKVPLSNPVMLYVQAAIDAKEVSDDGFEANLDGDDIPF